MMTIGERLEVKEFIPTKANDIPMAKASMLVAIALSRIHISMMRSPAIRPTFSDGPPWMTLFTWMVSCWMVNWIDVYKRQS